MNIQTQSQNYFNTALQSGYQQNIQGRTKFELPGGIALWSAVGKVLLMTLPLVLVVNLWISTAIDATGTKMQVEELALSDVLESNLVLRAEKAELLSPESMQLVAEEKLSLRVPTPQQIIHL